LSRVAHVKAKELNAQRGGVAVNGNIAPLPLLVVSHWGTSAALLEPLLADARFEIFVTKDLTPTWVSFARRVAAGMLLLTTDELLSALVYARTAGIEENLVLTVDETHRVERRELENSGATCVSIPFSPTSRDRIATVLSATRSLASVEPTLRLLFDPIGRVVRYRDKSLRLSQREFALLHCLAQHHGRPVCADQILSYVWDNGSSARSRQIVDVYVCQLRRKLTQIGLTNTIQTLRGFGYTLQAERAAH